MTRYESAKEIYAKLGDVWEEYCRRCNVAAEDWFGEIEN